VEKGLERCKFLESLEGLESLESLERARWLNANETECDRTYRIAVMVIDDAFVIPASRYP
jgi:hypothetical protein